MRSHSFCNRHVCCKSQHQFQILSHPTINRVIHCFTLEMLTRTRDHERLELNSRLYFTQIWIFFLKSLSWTQCVPQKLNLAQSRFFLEFYSKYLRLLESCLKSQLNNKMAAKKMIMQNIVRQMRVLRGIQNRTNPLEMFTEEEIFFIRNRFISAIILFICGLVENALKHPTNRNSPLPPLLQV